jgi:hypothetical protein
VSLPTVAAAEAKRPRQRSFIKALDRMMVQLTPQSIRASKAIRQAYQDHLDLLVLEELGELQGALANGGLAPLPADPLRFNLKPRLTGFSPIGEKDLDNQVSYIAARPATIGCLLDVASRVKSGPLEVTSLVRHTEYQGALRATNVNATTSVPMHTMGLAFDISLVNTPLPTVYEIRDVLRRMRDAGDLLFIGERRQLVFHVVPHPSRLGHFTDVYARFVRARRNPTGTHVVAFSTVKDRDRASGTPSVSAQVIAVLPSEEIAAEWWAADHARADVTVVVTAPTQPEPAAMTPEPSSSTPGSAGRLLLLTGALLVVAWRTLTPRPGVASLLAQGERFEAHGTTS